MTIARKHLIDYSQTCFYHCMSRCVRQGFLLNSVELAEGQVNYRNDWIQRRLLLLSDVFAIDLMAFAIMDNHTHLVLFANLELAKQWTNIEVLKRWSRIGRLPLSCQLYLDPGWRSRLNEVEVSMVLEQIDEYRRKLTDISVYMSRFNYYVARRANKEDEVSGHFWEARFKSQALLDMGAVLACMSYVDLNPIRANKAKTLQDSNYTSIKLRLDMALEHTSTKVGPIRRQFNEFNNYQSISLEDYVQHLSFISGSQDEQSAFQLIDEYCIDIRNWVKNTKGFEQIYTLCAGENELVAAFSKKARSYSGMQAKGIQAYSESILCRLLDYQCLCGKKHLYS